MEERAALSDIQNTYVYSLNSNQRVPLSQVASISTQMASESRNVLIDATAEFKSTQDTWSGFPLLLTVTQKQSSHSNRASLRCRFRRGKSCRPA